MNKLSYTTDTDTKEIADMLLGDQIYGQTANVLAYGDVYTKGGRLNLNAAARELGIEYHHIVQIMARMKKHTEELMGISQA